MAYINKQNIMNTEQATNEIYMEVINKFNRLPFEERLSLLKLLKQHHKDAEVKKVFLQEE